MEPNDADACLTEQFGRPLSFPWWRADLWPGRTNHFSSKTRSSIGKVIFTVLAVTSTTASLGRWWSVWWTG
jgi:hypothetical protein